MFSDVSARAPAAMFFLGAGETIRAFTIPTTTFPSGFSVRQSQVILGNKPDPGGLS
jgi:hypothetical protein